MTREDAIEEIKRWTPILLVSGQCTEKTSKAQDMAISALSENKGEWIKIQSGDKDFPEIIVCNKCYHENSHLDFNEHNEPIGKVFVKSNFCPNCGADMRGKAEE